MIDEHWAAIHDQPYTGIRKNKEGSLKTTVCILNRILKALDDLYDAVDTKGHVTGMTFMSFYRNITYAINDMKSVVHAAQFENNKMTQRSYINGVLIATQMEFEAGIRSLNVAYEKDGYVLRIDPDIILPEATFPVAAFDNMKKVVEDKRSDILYLYQFRGYLKPIPEEVDDIVVALSLLIAMWYMLLKEDVNQHNAEKAQKDTVLLKNKLDMLLAKCEGCRLVNIHLQINDSTRTGFNDTHPHSFDDFGGWRYEIKQLIEMLFKLKCNILACIYRVNDFKDLISYQVHYLMMALKNIKACIKAQKKGRDVNYSALRIVNRQLARAWIRNDVFKIFIISLSAKREKEIKVTLHDAMKSLSFFCRTLPSCIDNNVQPFIDALPMLGEIVNKLITSYYKSNVYSPMLGDAHTRQRANAYMEIFYSLFQLDMLTRAELKMRGTSFQTMSMVNTVDNKFLLSSHAKLLIDDALSAIRRNKDEQKAAVLFKDIERFLDNDIHYHDREYLHKRFHNFMVVLFDLIFTFTSHEERLQFAIDRITNFHVYALYVYKKQIFTITTYMHYYINSITMLSPILFALAPAYDNVCRDAYRCVKHIIHSIFVVELPFNYTVKPFSDANYLISTVLALQVSQRLFATPVASSSQPEPFNTSAQPESLNTSYDTDDHCYHPSDF